jgi:phosphate transport system permease protein
MRELGARKLKNALALGLASLSALIGLSLLAIILLDVFRNGVGALNPELFTKDPVPPNLGIGGLKSAFLGQGLLTLVAAAIGVPVGVLAGTFLCEYGRNLRISKVISSLSDVAVSIPSIVVGTFIYAVIVLPTGGFSGWAGALALAVIILPVIIRTTEEMMGLVPWSLREAAFALGAPYHKVIIGIVYRGAASGIVTGVLLAVARIAGETAPLLFTSFNNNFFSLNMSKPVPSLTVSIYQYAASPYEAWVKLAWGASFVITILVLVLNILGRTFVKLKVRK